MDMAHVQVLQLPVGLWRDTQEHMDELTREFMLIATEDREKGDEHDVPQQLLTIIDELTQRYAGFGEENEARLVAAAEGGVPEINLVYDLPIDITDDVIRLGQMLDLADDFCRRGEHLLTLATPPDQVRFRRWFLDEMVRQAGGQQPTPWPDYSGD